MTRRRSLLHAALALALPGTARAGYNVWTGEYTVGRAELEAAVAARFPAQLRYAGAFDVALTEPQLALLPEANRLAIACRLSVAQPALLPAPLTGVLAASSGLRYDAARRAVLLHEPTADKLELPGLQREDARLLQAVGTTVARELLRDWPVHTVPEEALRFGGRNLTLGAITVKPDGLAVEVR